MGSVPTLRTVWTDDCDCEEPVTRTEARPRKQGCGSSKVKDRCLCHRSADLVCETGLGPGQLGRLHFVAFRCLHSCQALAAHAAGRPQRKTRSPTGNDPDLQFTLDSRHRQSFLSQDILELVHSQSLDHRHHGLDLIVRLSIGWSRHDGDTFSERVKRTGQWVNEGTQPTIVSEATP